MRVRKMMLLAVCLLLVFGVFVHANANTPQQLVLWPSNEPQLVEFAKVMAERFEQEFGVKVVVHPLRLADQPGQLVLDGPAGTGPDVFTFSQDNLGTLVVQGLVEPLEGELAIEEAKVNAYLPMAIGTMTYEGKIYGIPHSVDTYALLYNKALVPQAPATFEELKEISHALRASDNTKYGFLYSAEFFYFNHCFLAGFGGYVFGRTDDGRYDVTDIGLNNDGAQEGLAFIKSLFAEGIMPADVDYAMADSQFMEGNAGMIISGPWAYDTFIKAGIDLGVAPLPMLPNGQYPVSLSGARALGISSYSQNKEWARKLADYMTSTEALKLRFEMTSAIPPLKELENDIAQDPYSAAIFTQIERAVPMPSVPEMGPVWGAIDDAVNLVVRDQASPKEALDEAVEIIKESIAEMRQ